MVKKKKKIETTKNNTRVVEESIKNNMSPSNSNNISFEKQSAQEDEKNSSIILTDVSKWRQRMQKLASTPADSVEKRKEKNDYTLHRKLNADEHERKTRQIDAEVIPIIMSERCIVIAPMLNNSEKIFDVADTQDEEIEKNAKEEIGLMGFINFGLVCYLNSVIQNLLSIPRLTDYFCSEAHRQVTQHFFIIKCVKTSLLLL
jgi:hypothetical protein